MVTQYPTSRSVVALILLLLLVALCMPFLNNPLIFDDQPFFEIGKLERLLAGGFQFSPRWWVYSTYALTFVHVGPEVLWQRLPNLALHIGTAVALYYFTRRLILDLDRAQSSSLSAAWVALLASSIFAFHPLAIFTQGYLVQRTTLCSTLFALLSWILLWQALKGSRAALWASCGAFILAVFSKEHAIMTPVVSALLILLFCRSEMRLKVRSGELALAMFAQALVGLFVLLQLKGIIGSFYEPFAGEMMNGGSELSGEILYPLSVLNQAGLFFKYELLWIFPNSRFVAIDMREPFPVTFNSGAVWLGLLLFIAYGVFAIRMLLRGRVRGLVGLALIVPWVLYFTEFAAVRLQEPFALYRSYLWVPLLFLALAVGARRLSNGLVVVIAPILLLYCAALSYDRLMVLSHPYLAWNEAAELLERNGLGEGVFGAYRIYYNRGIALYNEGMLDGARDDFERVLRLKPGYGSAYRQLGNIHEDRGEWDEARIAFESAIRAVPEDSKSYLGRANALEKLGDSAEAHAALRAACGLGNREGCERAGADPKSTVRSIDGS